MFARYGEEGRAERERERERDRTSSGRAEGWHSSSLPLHCFVIVDGNVYFRETKAEILADLSGGKKGLRGEQQPSESK